MPILALLGGSTIGPVNNFVPCKENVLLTQVWRFLPITLISLVLFPAWVVVHKHRGSEWRLFRLTPSKEGEKQWSAGVIAVIVVLTQSMNLGWSYGNTWASLNTVQAHAYVLTGLHGPATLLIYMAMCRKTHWLEKVGTVIVVIGAALMILDP